MAFISEYSFAEKVCDRNLLKKFPKNVTNRALVIIGEIIAADYDIDVDWTKITRTKKLSLRHSFDSIIEVLRSNSLAKRDKYEGLSKVRAFISSDKYSMLFPNSIEVENDDNESNKR